MRGLNLDHLQTFAEVVERGSFSAAAERVGLSQPAVSLQIKELERRFGVRLLERIGKRVEPTTAGRELLVHATRIKEIATAAVEAVAEHSSGVSGRVRLGTGATACIYLLPPVLRALRTQFPSLEIVVRTGNSSEILKLIEDNALDIGLVTLPAAGRIFQVTPVLDDELVAVFAEDDAKAPTGKVTATVLAELPVVLYEPGGNARRVINEWFMRAAVCLKPVMELGNVEAIKELVAEGLGCAVLPRLAVAGGMPHRLIVRPLAPPLHRKLGMILRRDEIPDRSLPRS
jgi:DNA-binding transcriptional LysR family regulator